MAEPTSCCARPGTYLAGDPNWEVTLAWSCYQRLRSAFQAKDLLESKKIALGVLELLHKLDDDRPIRLLGGRAEMLPPEGGYDPPRTHGRRGGP